MPQLPQQPQASLALACGRITLGMALADDFARIRLATSLVSVTLHTLPISTFKLPRSVMKQSFRVNHGDLSKNRQCEGLSNIELGYRTDAAASE
jgi:hypothetical protein